MEKNTTQKHRRCLKRTNPCTQVLQPERQDAPYNICLFYACRLYFIFKLDKCTSARVRLHGSEHTQTHVYRHAPRQHACLVPSLKGGWVGSFQLALSFSSASFPESWVFPGAQGGDVRRLISDHLKLSATSASRAPRSSWAARTTTRWTRMTPRLRRPRRCGTSALRFGGYLSRGRSG